jgi:adenosine deaminase
MDNLRRAIRLLFVDYCSDFILQTKYPEKYVNERVFLENGFRTFSNYSLDEINNVYQKLDTDWFIDTFTKQKNYFNILNHFTSKLLVEENLEPFVNYQHLLKWRDLSYYTSEDLMTTSFFAAIDNKSQRKRAFFAWRPTAFSDNKRLRLLLNKGLAENHFHLKGSGPVFDLSWLNIMNNPTRFEDRFSQLKNEISLLTKISNAPTNSKKELKVLVYKAAYLRYKLFCLINGINTENPFNIDVTKDSNAEDSYDLLLKMSDLTREIDLLKFDVGHKFTYRGNNDCVIDYAIPKNIHASNFDKSYVFYGERKLLYDCFQLIYKNDESFKSFIHLFHAYLLIKAQFRAELIQVNDKIGFGNFSKYQDRKEYFLPDDSIYHTAFMNLAVHDTKKHSEIKSFELRIAPKGEAIKLNNSIEGYNIALNKKAIQSNMIAKLPNKINVKKGYNISKDNIFYSIHYIKKKDEQNLDSIASNITCRHSVLRKEIKDQTIAISQLRESYSSLSKHIRGIDAASSEFDAPPEVFAQGFRYLKNHKLKGDLNHLKSSIDEPKIYATYHAGEDFYDIVDGLRAIDECIKFGNFKQGDRIGHALALGIDVKEYYLFKQNKLMIPKQIVIDNIVWLLAKIRKYGIAIHRNEINRLEKLFENLYFELYTSNYDAGHPLKEKSISHTTYFDAWKLRGDDPYLYFDELDLDVYKKINLTYWERCRINDEYPKVNNIRQNIDAKRIIQAYHFNPKIKKTGKLIKQFEISYSYMELVNSVQELMMHDIKNCNVAIETNPTSNYLIGTFKRYAKHPITKFFNLGLESNSDVIKNCPQISVSINTDDQGIFSTSLENEYALMAIALEKEKNEDGSPKYNSSMIYEYLERIRLMGLGQSFNN